jgi:hypothetical protein
MSFKTTAGFGNCVVVKQGGGGASVAGVAKGAAGMGVAKGAAATGNGAKASAGQDAMNGGSKGANKRAVVRHSARSSLRAVLILLL